MKQLLRQAMQVAAAVFQSAVRKTPPGAAPHVSQDELSWNGAACGGAEIHEQERLSCNLRSWQSASDRYRAGTQLKSDFHRDRPPAHALSSTINNDDIDWLYHVSGEARPSGRTDAEDQDTVAERTAELFFVLFELFANYARQFNCLVGASSLRVAMSPPGEVSESRKVQKQLALSTIETIAQITYWRWRASTGSWSVSARARAGVIEMFLVPCSDAMLPGEAAPEASKQVKIELRRCDDSYQWMMDNLPAAVDDLRVSIKQLFKMLIRTTQESEQPLHLPGRTHEEPQELSPGALNRLLLERQNLAHKVVSQQEEIQRQIARDLHDAVISEALALQRYLASNCSGPHTEYIVGSLNTMMEHLREICYELSPRDLRDWGLQVVLEDLVESFSQRTGIDCVMNCDTEIPALPSAVELHLYRIVQECFNNVLKHAAGATRVALTVELKDNKLVLHIEDNGKGFEENAHAAGRSSGYGMTSMKERVELIRAFLPVRLHVQSVPSNGAITKLELELPPRI